MFHLPIKVGKKVKSCSRCFIHQTLPIERTASLPKDFSRTLNFENKYPRGNDRMPDNHQFPNYQALFPSASGQIFNYGSDQCSVHI